MRLNNILYPIIGMAMLSLGICTAQASTVVYEDSEVVFANTTSTNPFEVIKAGTYEAKLVDFEYTSAFDILSLNITQDDTVLGFGFDTGTFTFNVLTPGTLMAHLVANPKDGKKGLYALQVSAIPIPPAALLFISGLAGIVIVSRRGNAMKMA